MSARSHELAAGQQDHRLLPHSGRGSESSAVPPPVSQATWFGVALIVLAFLLLRGPVMWRSPGGQDEEWYGIPGLMVARTGFPSVPYARATNPKSVFLGADRMIFAMPPAAFYAQSPFFLMLPPTYGTARMASLAAGCVAIVTVFLLGRGMLADSRIGLCAAGVYSLSRLLFFPATFARPDMLCGMFGLLSVWALWQWTVSRRKRPLVFAGICLGLAGLTHPFAIVFAMQLFPWIVLSGSGLKRTAAAFAVLATTTAVTFGLWTPLIVMAPDLFESQFLNNIVAPAGPGLLMRLIAPWESLTHHVPQLVERAHPIQFVMLLGGWIVLGIVIGNSKWRSNHAANAAPLPAPGRSALWLLAGSSVYLLIACQGIHPIQGYWCYPAGLLSLSLAAVVVPFADHLMRITGRRRIIPAVVMLSFGLALLPGSGVRTVVAHVRHAADVNYDSAAFIDLLLADLPSDATLTVGIEYALPAFGRGRDVVLGIRHPMYFDSTQVPTDFVILGRLGLAEQLDRAFDAELIRTYGDADDEFSCYAEVYRVRARPRQ